jgi:hypothetical protein
MPILLSIHKDTATAVFTTNEINIKSSSFSHCEMILFSKEHRMWSEQCRLVPTDDLSGKSSHVVFPTASAIDDNVALIAGVHSTEKSRKNGILNYYYLTLRLINARDAGDGVVYIFNNRGHSAWSQVARIVPELSHASPPSVFGCSAQVRANTAVILSCIEWEDYEHRTAGGC